LSYYDGARRLGSILERNGVSTAFDVQGVNDYGTSTVPTQH